MIDSNAISVVGFLLLVSYMPRWWLDRNFSKWSPERGEDEVRASEEAISRSHELKLIPNFCNISRDIDASICIYCCCLTSISLILSLLKRTIFGVMFAPWLTTSFVNVVEVGGNKNISLQNKKRKSSKYIIRIPPSGVWKFFVLDHTCKILIEFENVHKQFILKLSSHGDQWKDHMPNPWHGYLHWKAQSDILAQANWDEIMIVLN